MVIAFEGQPICSNTKTGIGLYTYNIIKSMLEIDKDSCYRIHFFDFIGKDGSEAVMESFFACYENIFIKKNRYLLNGIYLRGQGIFKYFSYDKLFHSNANITHFFNFLVPVNIKSKTIVTVYDMVYKRYPETMSRSNYILLHKGLKRSCDQADKILTISENSKMEIAEFMNVPLDKIEIAYPAVNTNIYYPRECSDVKKALTKYKIDSDYILYLGTLEPRKNVETLIKAFNQISLKNRDIKLVIAGSKGWKYDTIYKLVEELKLFDRVIFTGYIDEGDKPKLYSGAIAFVFPSLYEGFGMPPLEAMACGTPVITSNISSLPEVIGNAGITVNPKDIENIAFEIDSIINNELLRKQYSDKGILRSRSFTWENSAKKVLEIYKKLI